MTPTSSWIAVLVCAFLAVCALLVLGVLVADVLEIVLRQTRKE